MPGRQVLDREVEEDSIWFERGAPNPVVEVEGEAETFPFEVDESRPVGACRKAQNFGIKPPHGEKSVLAGMDDDAHEFGLALSSHRLASLPQFSRSA